LGDPPGGNLFSQNPAVNVGAYRTFEYQIRLRLNEHQDWTAYAVVNLTYNPPVSGFSSERTRNRAIGVNYSVLFFSNGKIVDSMAGHFRN
jgi:hypothetical protein